MRARASGAGATWASRARRSRAPTSSSSAALLDARGTRATFATPVGRLEIDTPLVGDYNLENLALAVGMAIARGLPADAIARGRRATSACPGRLERVANERGVLCVVDYAHTPDALERAIAAMRAVTHAAADRRVRLRRRSRSRQAADHGRDRGARRRPGDRHLRQPAHRGSGRDRRHDPRRRPAHGRAEAGAPASWRGATRGYHARGRSARGDPAGGRGGARRATCC